MSTTEQKALAEVIAGQSEIFSLSLAPGSEMQMWHKRNAIELRRLSAENAELATQLATRDAELATLRAQVGVLTAERDHFAQLSRDNGQTIIKTACDLGDAKSEIVALRAQAGALTKPQEPVAWLYHDAPTLEDCLDNERQGFPVNSVLLTIRQRAGMRNETPLYTHPAPSPLTRPAVPEGWKLVPVVPTAQMIDAALAVDPAHESVWAAYLAAAPQPEATIKGSSRVEAQPIEHPCYCGNEISLQSVSGGAAPEGLYGRVTLLVDGKYQDYVKSGDARDPVEAQPTEAAQPVRYLQESDQQLLRRFIETSDDDQPFDIGVPAVKRLADLGVVRNCGFGKYAVTMFGYWVHEHFWHQNPALPLMTNADRDAAQKAKLAAQKGGV